MSDQDAGDETRVRAGTGGTGDGGRRRRRKSRKAKEKEKQLKRPAESTAGVAGLIALAVSWVGLKGGDAKEWTAALTAVVGFIPSLISWFTDQTRTRRERAAERSDLLEEGVDALKALVKAGISKDAAARIDETLLQAAGKNK